MIEDGIIVLRRYENALQTWRIEPQFLNAIVIGIVTTILSYQLAAAVSDLLLGLKPRFETRASDFHAAILTDEGSLKSILAALLRKDWLDRARFPRKIPHDTSIAREPCHVKKRIVLKTLILLISAPLINLGAIIITLEHDQEITFARAKFGGLAVGANEDLSIIVLEDFTEKCFTIPFEVEDHQQAKVSFFGCFEVSSKDSDGSWMSVRTGPDETVVLTLVVSGIQYERTVYFDLEVDQQTFRIRQRMTERMLRSLLEFGNSRLEKFCLTSDSSTSDVVVRRDDETRMEASRNVSCTQIGGPAANFVASSMAVRVTLVVTEAFEVVRDSDRSEKPTYVRADDLILLEQRTSYAGSGTLFVAAGIALILRIIVKLLTRNDVHDGITILIRTCFGVESGSSLLRWKGTVRYDYKHQEGETAHFGVKTDKPQEVEEFMQGEVGVVDERPLIEKCVTVEEAMETSEG